MVCFDSVLAVDKHNNVAYCVIVIYHLSTFFISLANSIMDTHNVMDMDNFIVLWMT